MDASTATVSVQSTAVFWLETISAPLFRSNVGRSVHVYPSATIYFPWNLGAGDESAIGEQVFVYNLGRVTLGSRVTISHRAHLCAGTHDHTKPDFPLLGPPILIRSDAWICADAFVGPGVTVGEGAIVGARAVAMKDVKPRSIMQWGTRRTKARSARSLNQRAARRTGAVIRACPG